MVWPVKFSRTWKYVQTEVDVCHPVGLPVVVVVGVEAVAHVAEQLETGTDREEELTRRLPQPEPVLIAS